ncbi:MULTISPECIES: M50 family metallopeptidase [unclassified Vibrio]|uniref:Peptidase M50 n=1 Tax=Vibrio sp. HB236076 TaxID=3232307 RepID=A0AB39HI80_9VIBR|nr:M50 family metallopeptidase [Vibrio sp. HB161653]MDP5255138.1 M50 family metallopeptidase [Vibrio sp. HB161653]
MENENCLPRLRSNLKIIKGDFKQSTGQSWKIFDPIRNKYFLISHQDVQILNNWNGNNVDDICLAFQRAGSMVSEKEIESLYQFLKQNELLSDKNKEFNQDSTGSIKGILFSKIPIVSFNKVSFFVCFLFGVLDSLKFKVFVIALFFLNLYLLSGSWSQYINYSKNLFNFNGFWLYFFAIVFVKVFHEMSHAFIAKKLGATVGNFGIVTFFGFPLLYTEIERTEELESKYDRVSISLAGIKVELIIAVLATFLWFVSPDGFLKEIYFVISSSSWVMSLLVNLNPLAKFDGYYVLSDCLEIDNLHSRAGNYFLYITESFIFNCSRKNDDFSLFTVKQKIFIYIYGMLTKIYRVFVVFAVCFAVYYFNSYLLLTLVAFYFFGVYVLSPFFSYVISCYSLFKETTLVRKFAISFFVFMLLVVSFFPINTRVISPATVTNLYSPIYTAESGLVTQIKKYKNGSINQGDDLLILSSIDIENQLEKRMREQELIQYKIDGVTGNEQDKRELVILYQRLYEVQEAISGLMESSSELRIQSSLSGTLVDTISDITIGRFLAKGTKLGEVLTDEMLGVSYIQESDFKRITLPIEAKFYPKDLTIDPFMVNIYKIDNTAAKIIDEVVLTSRHGGRILVKDESSNGFVPNETYFKLYFTVASDVDLNNKLVGSLSIPVDNKSYFSIYTEQLWKVLLQEMRR